MKALRVAEDIVPIAQFKGQAAHWLDHAAKTGQPFVITQNGRPAAVVMSPVEYDRLQDRQRLLESIAAGIADAEAGRVMSTKERQRRLASRRKGRQGR